MKKIKLLCIAAIFAASFMPTQISAKVATNETVTNENVTIEYLENGDYIETIITEEKPSDTIMARATSSKSGSKAVYYKNASGEIQWSVAVNANFTYSGLTSTCTYAWVTTTCPSKVWKVSESSAIRSGNSATAYATGKLYMNGVVIQTINRSVKLTCSGNGTLS